jgi:hypothetical protein
LAILIQNVSKKSGPVKISYQMEKKDEPRGVYFQNGEALKTEMQII